MVNIDSQAPHSVIEVHLPTAGFRGTRIPASTGGHVRDVAVGDILAAGRGQPGEHYVLGHADVDWPLGQNPRDAGEAHGGPRFSNTQLAFGRGDLRALALSPTG